MSLKTFKESIGKGRKLVQENAAVTNELTKEFSKESTVFSVPAEGLSRGTLLFELRSHGAHNVEVAETSSGFTITTTNPNAVQKILKQLGLSVENVGGQAEDLITTPDAADSTSTTGVLGESWIKRTTKRLKKYIK